MNRKKIKNVGDDDDQEYNNNDNKNNNNNNDNSGLIKKNNGGTIAIKKTERNVLDLNQKAANELRNKMTLKTHQITHMTAPELIFLGTGSAAPSTLRNSSSIYLNLKKPFLGNILIDVGITKYDFDKISKHQLGGVTMTTNPDSVESYILLKYIF